MPPNLRPRSLRTLLPFCWSDGTHPPHLVVLGVVDVHGHRVHMGLQGSIVVGQGGQGEGHFCLVLGLVQVGQLGRKMLQSGERWEQGGAHMGSATRDRGVCVVGSPAGFHTVFSSQDAGHANGHGTQRGPAV